MRKTILIICPEFPPCPGGVAAHTFHLAENLSKIAHVEVLTSKGITPRTSDAFKVHARISNWHDVDELFIVLESLECAQLIIWQYVPHMYGRGGINLQLPGAMLALERMQRQQLVIAHEIAAPISWWPHRLIYALAHRWQWRRILSCVDAVGISTEAWIQQAAKAYPEFRAKFSFLPSPATIPVIPVAAGHPLAWRRERGLPENARIIAFFGTQSSAKQFHLVARAWQETQSADAPVALVAIGERPDLRPPGELAHLYLALDYLDEGEVSRALQAIDVLALPFIDGVSERRTSFMAGISHGCTVVTTTGHNTGPTLKAAKYIVAADATDAAGFVAAIAECLGDAKRRQSLGESARLAYESKYSWPRVTRLVQEALTYRG